MGTLFKKIPDTGFKLMNHIQKPITALMLIRLMPIMDNINSIRMPLDELAMEVGSSKSNLSIAIAEMKKLDIVRKLDKSTYIFNPDLIYKGRDKEYFVIQHYWDSAISHTARG